MVSSIRYYVTGSRAGGGGELLAAGAVSRAAKGLSGGGGGGGGTTHMKSRLHPTKTLCGRKIKDVDWTTQKKKVSCKKCKKLMK